MDSVTDWSSFISGSLKSSSVWPHQPHTLLWRNPLFFRSLFLLDPPVYTWTISENVFHMLCVGKLHVSTCVVVLVGHVEGSGQELAVIFVSTSLQLSTWTLFGLDHTCKYVDASLSRMTRCVYIFMSRVWTEQVGFLLYRWAAHYTETSKMLAKSCKGLARSRKQ